MNAKSWLTIAVIALGATGVHAATASCSEELKSCRDRCKNEHKFTGSQLRNCEEQACPAAWGICMHSRYWTVAKTRQKIGAAAEEVAINERAEALLDSALVYVSSVAAAHALRVAC